MPVSNDLDRRVRQRAKGFCEYCRLPQAFDPWAFHVDHVIANQHGGKSQLNNLALACSRCNRNKGPNIAGFDKYNSEIVRLYHPRRDKWTDHFRWRGPRLLGLTPFGRVTIRVLAINHPEAVALRRELIAEGVFPPDV
ncbi:MAG TPA: HNH endonuclease signature motif containing protein [Isosphaeraceae bacterium]|nr:HNH endonuclease signature motif containing protein [Isosphaeraceae bacterium]